MRIAIARLKARETDARKDWCEKVSTGLASGFDVIRVEDLKITNMTRSVRGAVAEPGRNVKAKAGLNREITTMGGQVAAGRLASRSGRCRRCDPAATRAAHRTGRRA